MILRIIYIENRSSNTSDMGFRMLRKGFKRLVDLEKITLELEFFT